MKYSTKNSLVEIAIYLNALITIAISLSVYNIIVLVTIGIISVILHNVLCSLHSEIAEMILLESMIEEIEELTKKRVDKQK